MVELQVVIGVAAVLAVSFVLWRQRQNCLRKVQSLAQQEAAEAQAVRVTAVDVPPMARFPTAEDALDLLQTTALPVKRKKRTAKNPGPNTAKKKKR